MTDKVTRLPVSKGTQPAETSAQRSARLRLESIAAARAAVDDLVRILNDAEAAMLDIADLDVLPAGVREMCSRKATEFAPFVQGVEAIMQRSVAR